MLVIVLRRSRYPEGSSGAAAMTSIRAAATHFHCRRAWNVRKYRRNVVASVRNPPRENETMIDRKSTRLNSSHTVISYAVFCLKKKKKKKKKHLATCVQI